MTATFRETAIPNRNAGGASTEICLSKNKRFACQCYAKTGNSPRHIIQSAPRPRPHYGGSRMETINEALQMICFILLFLLLFKDMSGKDELRRIREELKRIADALERREQDGNRI